MNKESLQTIKIIPSSSISSWLYRIFFLFAAAALLMTIEQWKYKLFFTIGTLVAFILFLFFQKSKFGEPQNIVSMLGVGVGVVGSLMLIVFGQHSLTPMLVLLGLCIASAVYVFSLRRYRGISSEIDHLQGPEYDWKGNKFILLIVLPWLLVGLAIIFGIPALFVYAWLFLR